MSFKDQVINLIIQGRDLFSSEAKKSEKALGELASQSEILNNRLTELQNQQNSIRRIEELTGAIKKGEQSFKDSSVALDQLVAAQKDAAAESKRLEQSQKAGSAELNRLQAAQAEAASELQRYESQTAQVRREVERLTSEQKKGASAGAEQALALEKSTAELSELEKAQRQSAAAAEQLNQELQQQEQRLRETEQAATNAAITKAEYALKVKSARGELNQLGSTLNKNQSEYKQHEQTLRSAGISMDKLADASRDLKQQQSAAETAISGVNDKLSRHEKLLAQSSKTAGDFKGSITAATGSLVAMASAYLGIDRLKDSIFSVLESGDKAAAFTAQMTAMMGSIEAGEQATAWIKEFADSTGTRLDAAKQAFASLKTFGIDPMNGAMRSLTDYSAKLGGGQERLEGIILAVGQAWAKQKLQGEEILQLVERGVPVWDMLAAVTGKNTVELQKLSEAGQLGRDTIKGLFDEMGKQANGQAATSLNRLSGQVNLLSNNWESFKQRIADSGAYQVAVNFLKELNAKFDELNASGRIKQAAEDISAFFSTIIRDGGSGLSATLENITAFTRALGVVSGSIRLIFNSISAGVSVFGAAISQYFSNMANGIANVMEALGSTDIAGRLRSTGEMLQAVSEAYKAQVESDSADIKKAWQSVTGEVEVTTAKSAAKVTETLKTETGKQVAEIQKVKQAEEERAKRQEELSLLMSKAGIVSVNSLSEQEKAAKATYDQINEAYKNGSLTAYEVKQAYEAWAESSLKLAAAQGKAVPEALKTEAAAKNLTGTLDGLIQKNQDLKASNDAVSQHQAKYVSQIDSTKKSIEQLTAVTNSSTASAEEKAKAQKELTQRQQELTDQTAELNRMKLLEAKTYGQLVQEYRTTQDELDNLNESYVRGAIATDYYVKTKERLESRLGVLTGLIGDFAQKQKETVAAIENSNISLREQAEEMDKVAAATGRATRYHSMFAEAHVALNQQFDFSAKSSAELSARYDELAGKIWNNAQVTGQFWGMLADEFDKGFAREQMIIAQTLQYRQLFDELQSGTVTMARLSQISDIANQNLGALNSTDMSSLQEAISAAHGRLKALSDDLAGTVSNLRLELAQLRGEKDFIEQEQYRARTAELESKLKQAEAAGDQESIASARQALDLARQIAEVKKQQRLDEAAQAAEKAKQKDQTTPKSQATKAPEPVVSRPEIQPASATAATKPAETVLVLQLGSQRYPTNMDSSTLERLMSDIRRQQSVGG